jgi:hypothetical protein
MAFFLENVVPWGRNFTEYRDMFRLTNSDLKKKMIGFGDGPASFNLELTNIGGNIISLDPIYQFSREEIETRINETKDIVIEQTKQNKENYIWKSIKNVKELEDNRMKAMKQFLFDYEKGKEEGRYRYHELPSKTEYSDEYFELGLSSHFLLLYTSLGEEFHIKSINEMLRICKEVRIFPIVDLDGNYSKLAEKIIKHYASKYDVHLVKVDYQFQKNGNMMLKIKKRMKN